MATLQKFKLLATQCAVAGSPTRSPTASPVIHLRRRKTLRMLLARGGSGGRSCLARDDSPDRRGSADEGSSPEKGKQLSVSHKLKDLFVSSPGVRGPVRKMSGKGCCGRAAETEASGEVRAAHCGRCRRRFDNGC
ncbi:hypothetical protein Sango_0089600 [Sesamum angolense]|uniref:Uncharacterized protein n=1 Tax=Sesamum angolense TaxID=2727404 RepID=A0AAE2C5W0_9LAMI|nr:hypothetical protein Sango_0089600 [Sesamum angolense]